MWPVAPTLRSIAQAEEEQITKRSGGGMADTQVGKSDRIGQVLDSGRSCPLSLSLGTLSKVHGGTPVIRADRSVRYN